MKRLLLVILIALTALVPSLVFSQQVKADPYPVGEVTSMRQQNSKTYYLGNNRYALDVAVGSVHYKDALNNWQNINNEMGAGVMAKAPYTFRLLQNTFNAGRIVEFARGGESIQLQPMSIQWTNDLDQIQQIAIPQAVSSIVTNTAVQLLPGVDSYQGKVTWEDAYGTGRDFQWVCTPTRLTKILIIPTFANLPAPPANILSGGNPCFRISLIFAPSAGLDIYVDNVLWTRGANSKMQTFGRIEFRKTSIGETLWDFAPMLYWDSGGNEGESIKTVRRVGSSLYVDIRVPYSWLQTATYPVSIDATLDVQVGAGEDDSRVFNLGWSNTSTFQPYGGSQSSQVYEGQSRFTSITIPPGSTIDTAIQTLQAIESNAFVTVNTLMAFEASDDATRVTSYADFYSRTLTAHTILHSNVPAWTVNTNYNSPELKTSLQDVIDRPGWASGQAISLFNKDNGSTVGLSIYRPGKSYNSSAANCAKLHIEYTAGEEPGTTPEEWIPQVIIF